MSGKRARSQIPREDEGEVQGRDAEAHHGQEREVLLDGVEDDGDSRGAKVADVRGEDDLSDQVFGELHQFFSSKN